VVGGPGPGEAEELDRADPLAWARERFVVPDEKLVYLDGNSLGRLPAATVARLSEVVGHEWGEALISSWGHWLDLPTAVGDLIGVGLLGARTGEVVVADSTTVNLYRLAAAALDARPGRSVIVTDTDNFPTDRYVLEGLAASRGGSVRWISSADPVHGPSAGELSAALDSDVALVSLSHVDYRSASVLDLAAAASLAHSAGALVLFDLCHSVGVVPVDLSAAGADLAVGCTYKYLCGGPGAPAFQYVSSEIQASLRQPIWGWWAREAMFEMAQGFVPVAGIRAFLSGTAPVLGLVCVEEGARLVTAAGLAAVREKSIQLTSYAVSLFDAVLAPLGFRLGSPREAERRGSHVLVCRADAASLSERLAAEAGVVTDFRMPDGIRLGLAPLTTRFRDVYDGVAGLAAIAGG
jgi:kynureninase